MSKPSLDERLRSNRPVILDGAMGTELERRGYRTYLPLWSAMAAIDEPGLLLEIHSDYLAAGAEIITANTFRTSAYTLHKTRQSLLAPLLTRLTVEIAREAITQSGRTAWLAASVAPLEDCYRPDLEPSQDLIKSAYAHQLDILASADIDLILVETMINVREALTLAQLISERDLPFMMSFTTDHDGRLLSGAALGPVVQAVNRCQPTALLVNCRPTADIDPGLQQLARYANCHVGVYANGAGTPDGTLGWKLEEGSDMAYAEAVRPWLDQGINIVGGCCGTTPATIRAITRLIQVAQDQ